MLQGAAEIGAAAWSGGVGPAVVPGRKQTGKGQGLLIVAGGAALLGTRCSAPGEFVEPPLPGLSFDVVAPLPGDQDASAAPGAGGDVTAVGARAAPPRGAVLGETGGSELCEVLPGPVGGVAQGGNEVRPAGGGGGQRLVDAGGVVAEAGGGEDVVSDGGGAFAQVGAPGGDRAIYRSGPGEDRAPRRDRRGGCPFPSQVRHIAG